jgi:hypothetical protein
MYVVQTAWLSSLSSSSSRHAAAGAAVTIFAGKLASWHLNLEAEVVDT